MDNIHESSRMWCSYPLTVPVIIRFYPGRIGFAIWKHNRLSASVDRLCKSLSSLLHPFLVSEKVKGGEKSGKKEQFESTLTTPLAFRPTHDFGWGSLLLIKGMQVKWFLQEKNRNTLGLCIPHTREPTFLCCFFLYCPREPCLMVLHLSFASQVPKIYAWQLTSLDCLSRYQILATLPHLHLRFSFLWSFHSSWMS